MLDKHASKDPILWLLAGLLVKQGLVHRQLVISNTADMYTTAAATTWQELSAKSTADMHATDADNLSSAMNS